MSLESLSPENNEFIALWDTGATNTVITEKVLQYVPLNPIGFTNVSGAYGDEPERRPVYLACIYLPNGVCINSIPVIKAEPKGCDILIGMDIIGKGDFVITNYDGHTVFTFRIPSQEKIDFVQKYFSTFQNVGRNDPCPCGSNKKFKKCHGK